MASILDKDKSSIDNILAFYNSQYHEIYLKALKILLGSVTRIGIYMFGECDVALWRIFGEKGAYWVMESDGKIMCTCPDFVLYIVGKRREREYCSHILAYLMCESGRVDEQKEGSRYKCRPRIYRMYIKDFLETITADLEEL